jgi:hypothetical protein
MGQYRAAAGGGDCQIKLFGKTIPVPDASAGEVDQVGVHALLLLCCFLSCWWVKWELGRYDLLFMGNMSKS